VPIVTLLAPDPRQPGYRLVEVDRGRFASIPAAALDAFPTPLAVGVELEGPALARLQALADVEAACRAALRSLETRGRARRDLRRRLLQKQHPPEAVDEALARLEARGLLDDRRFAAEYAARRAAAGRGAQRLVTDLLAQGVDRGVAQTAVTEALAQEGVDARQMARTVAVRRAAQLGDLPAAVRKRRLLAYLARRGYSAVEVKELVEELCR
jgi:regulatory protein